MVLMAGHFVNQEIPKLFGLFLLLYSVVSVF